MKKATKTTVQTLHEQQLKSIIDDITINSLTSYTLKGKDYTVYQQQPYTSYAGDLSTFGKNEGYNAVNQKSTLIQDLCNKIYSQFYCHLPSDTSSHQMPLKSARDEFMEQLSKSNFSSPQPDRNWRIYSVDASGNAFAQKNDELRPVRPNTYVPNPYQPQLTVNQTIDFYRFRENKAAQAVFYYVHSDEYLPHDCNMMRIYWNVHPQGASVLIEQITKVLNGYRIPFSFKCLNHPSLYNRSDSAVLYFNKDNLKIVSDLVDYIITIVQPFLKEEVPMFTTVITPGVSRAEDPGDGSSFGMSRSEAIATALVNAFEEEITVLELEQFVGQHLEKKGINPKNMSINPHTKHFLLN